jgi:hypothetical protein
VSEVWRPVVGFEGFYEVSSLGRVRSLARQVLCSDGRLHPVHGRILRPIVRGRYLCVLLADRDRSTKRSLHRIVCEAFHGAPTEPDLQVCHGNGDCRDNRAENLRWGTPLDNSADKAAHGTELRGSEHQNAVVTEQDVATIRALRAGGATYRSIGARFGLSISQVFRIAKCQSWRHVA